MKSQELIARIDNLTWDNDEKLKITEVTMNSHFFQELMIQTKKDMSTQMNELLNEY
jgi:hypothetical protein